MKPKVSIVILNYNGHKFLKDCLDSIKAQTYSDIETIVVDNASSDESVTYLKSVPWIKLIVNKDNLGFSEGNNIGVKAASGEYLLILNNDTTIPFNFIEILIKSYIKNSIVVPIQILMSEPDSKGHAGNGMDIFGYPYGGSSYENTRVFYADGACFLMKRDDFLKIGMFDDKHFIFQEDVDLSWRAQLMGYKVVTCLKTKFRHYSGGILVGGAMRKKTKHVTSYFRRYLVEKNTIRNLLKNYSLPFLIPIMLVSILLNLWQVVILLISGKWKLARCFIDAYMWNVKNLRDTLEKRREVQAKRVVSDVELVKRMYIGYSKLTAFVRVGGFPIFK